MNDSALLRDYKVTGSEAAFETLVGRHLDMVYSAAFRQTGDASLAEEVAQAAFVLLARKASKLGESVVVPGWLYRTASFMARKAVGNRARRRAVEKEAAEMNQNDANDEVWSRLMPHLDAALFEMAETDRNALVLRFLQQRSFRDVADQLGVSEDAAKKRVGRALEKARRLLSRRGAIVTVATLGAAVFANSVKAAPVALCASAVKAALGAAPATGSGIAFLVAQASREALVSRLKRVTVLAAAAVVVLVAGGMWWNERPPGGLKGPSGQIAAVTPKPLPRQQLQAFAPAKRGMKRKLVLHLVSSENGAALGQGLVFGKFAAPPTHTRNTSTQPDPGVTFPVNASGDVPIPLPEGRFRGMQFWVTAPGRVPVSILWTREEEPSLPADYTVRLGQGARIGGTVVDESGHPVAGATLRFPAVTLLSGGSWDAREVVAYNTQETTPKTDAEGRWMADFIDAESDGNLFVTAGHPSFIMQTSLLKDLRAAGMSNVLVLQRGCRISGSLFDPLGNPVSRAQISLAYERGENQPPPAAKGYVQAPRIGPGGGQVTPSARTDDAGRFQLSRVLNGSYGLLVEADGFSSTNLSFTARGTETNFVLILAVSKETTGERNSILRGRVLDEDGQPVQRAFVHLDPNRTGLDQRQEQWYAYTDELGKFEWKHAPAHSVRVIIQGNPELGDWERESVDLMPDGTEALIRLTAETKMMLRLVVTDGQTGQPVPSFKVASGDSMPQGAQRAERLVSLNFIGEGKDGKLALFMPQNQSLAFSSSFASRYNVGSPKLLIRAPGFSDKAFPVPGQTNDMELAISLDRPLPSSGRVMRPDGLPAGGAEVSFLQKGYEPVMAKSGTFGPAVLPGATRVLTGADGLFRAQAFGIPALVTATHESGWGMTPFQAPAGTVIQLRSWSRLEGTVRLGGRVQAGVDVLASDLPGSTQQPQVLMRTKTDETGHFEFSKIPGHRVKVYFEHRLGETAILGSHAQVVTLLPGETTTVSIGGSGARVSGRAVAPAGVGPVAWAASTGGLYPIGDANSAGYPFAFRDDRSFVIEDVPPGKYALQMHLTPVRSGLQDEDNKGFEGTHRSVTIPQSLASGGDFDLGTIEVQRPAQGIGLESLRDEP